jgi:hypothetical protein
MYAVKISTCLVFEVWRWVEPKNGVGVDWIIVFWLFVYLIIHVLCVVVHLFEYVII